MVVDDDQDSLSARSRSPTSTPLYRSFSSFLNLVLTSDCTCLNASFLTNGSILMFLGHTSPEASFCCIRTSTSVGAFRSRVWGAGGSIIFFLGSWRTFRGIICTRRTIDERIVFRALTSKPMWDRKTVRKNKYGTFPRVELTSDVQGTLQLIMVMCHHRIILRCLQCKSHGLNF